MVSGQIIGKEVMHLFERIERKYTGKVFMKGIEKLSIKV